MTTQTTTLGSLNAATPGFYLDLGQQANVTITAPSFVGEAAIEKRIDSGAWVFVQEARNGYKPQLSGRDTYRVRITSYASGSLDAVFQTIDPPVAAVDTTSILNDAHAYADSAASAQASSALNSAKAYADSAAANAQTAAQTYADGVASNGGSGVFTLGTGGVATELAPSVAAGTWAVSNGATVTQDAGGIHFAAAANLAFADATITLKDNTTYDVSITIAGWTQGAVRAMVYGATTNHLGGTSSISANGTFTFQVTTSGTGSLSNRLRLQCTGASTPGNTLTVSAISLRETGGAAYPTRPVRAKFIESYVSLADFPGFDPNGGSDSTSAFAAAIAYGARKIYVPAGIPQADHLVVNQNVELFGESMDTTTIRITGAGRIHGLQAIGSAAAGLGNKLGLRDFTLQYIGTGQQVASGGNDNWAGIYAQRKIYAENVYVLGFTNDGIYYAPADAVEGATTTAGSVGNAVFFSRWTNCWSKSNGRDGMFVRMGANVIGAINCQFDKNKRAGYHHATDGGSTYGNYVEQGQQSYNSSYGLWLESGTNFRCDQIYNEYNGSPTNTNTDGYTNTAYDVYVGDNCVRSFVHVGVVFNNNNSHIRLPGFNPTTIQVWAGGQKLFGN